MFQYQKEWPQDRAARCSISIKHITQHWYWFKDDWRSCFSSSIWHNWKWTNQMLCFRANNQSESSIFFNVKLALFPTNLSLKLWIFLLKNPNLFLLLELDYIIIKIFTTKKNLRCVCILQVSDRHNTNSWRSATYEPIRIDLCSTKNVDF